MKKYLSIHLDNQLALKSFKFPDGQVQVNVSSVLVSPETVQDGVRVIAPLRSSDDVLKLLQLCNALDHMFIKRAELVIPYLLGARSDRVMQPGGSVYLETIAELINSLNFEVVNLFDVHSDVATALIKRCKNHNNSWLVKAYTQPNAVLIIPDAGAAKKADKYLTWNSNITQTVHCVKQRELTTGQVSLNVLNPQACHGQNCVIIDDLCDGGATFNAIADSLTKAGIKPSTLTLIVSHGVFSKGFTELEKNFTSIITSDSWPQTESSPVLTIVDIFSKL